VAGGGVFAESPPQPITSAPAIKSADAVKPRA
jgi:hypothetical protein